MRNKRVERRVQYLRQLYFSFFMAYTNLVKPRCSAHTTRPPCLRSIENAFTSGTRLKWKQTITRTCTDLRRKPSAMRVRRPATLDCEEHEDGRRGASASDADVRFHRPQFHPRNHKQRLVFTAATERVSQWPYVSNPWNPLVTASPNRCSKPIPNT